MPQAPRKFRLPGHADHQRDTRPSRSNGNLYNDVRWRGVNGLRQQVLREEPLCRECLKEGVVQPTTQVDHIRDHCGNEDLFFDRGNLQGLCATHHSRKTGSR